MSIERTQLGRTGLSVSRLCLGMMSFGSPTWRTWILDEAAGRPIIRSAVEHGINFFDTADIYSNGRSEEILGRAVREFFIRRDEAVVATKVFYTLGGQPTDGQLTRAHILKSIDDSLRRLGMDYVDLYQIHRYDPKTPIEETLEALHDVVRSGKARFIGASSMYAWQFAQMLYRQRARGWAEFVTMQNHYNLIYREEEREMNPFCAAERIALIPWSPLARGFLAGNRQRGRQDATPREASDRYGQSLYYFDSDYDVAAAVTAVARRKGVPPIHVALAWILNRPGVAAPIVSMTKQEQLDQLVEGATLQLTADEIAEVEAPYQPHPIRGHE
jgi:aryl-alcohol dehydrogenase-like predicted oxidoreductase